MQRSKKSLGLLLVAAALIALLPAGAGAAGSRAPVADLGVGGDAVVWTPRSADYDRLVLTVFGPNDYRLRQEVPSGASPALGLFDQAGFPLADGLYKYELVAVPRVDAATRERMTAARAAGDDSIVSTLRREGLLPAQTARQAGSFSIRGGAFVPSDLKEPSAGAASGPGPDALVSAPGPAPDFGTVLTNADGIIRNSLCVGFDCPNSPSFSDTTILMMENNTRIKFDDTSSLSGFPNRDWEIEANSASSGGANYLGINDCGTSSQGGCATDLVFAIEANVRQSALYVESDGDVGFGTSNPVVNLHVVDGNTPTLRLDQDGSGGFTPQVWDVAGNETNFFIRDATGGSALPFRIQPGAASNSLFIASDEDVGIGTSSPDAPLDIERNGSNGVVTLLRLTNTDGPQRLEFRDSSADAINWDFRTTSGDAFVITQPTSPSNDFQINSAGNVTIRGNLTLSTGPCVGCDGVFQPDYPLESIEEHSALMWAKSHLPGVGPTLPHQPMNISEKTGGILNELEKAHIYIEQLNQRVSQLEALLREAQAAK